MTEEKQAPAPTTDARYREIYTWARAAVAVQFPWKSAADRDDLVATVVLKYWREFGRGDAEHPRAWLRRAAQNAGRDAHRADLARPAHPAGDHLEDVAGGNEWVQSWLRGVERSGPSKAVARDHLVSEVLALVSTHDRELIELRYLDNLRAREVADRLGMNEAAVHQATRRATRRLAQALEARPDLAKELRAPMPRVH
jgi:RNA polymerase sigma factor (sigma-70 family)